MTTDAPDSMPADPREWRPLDARPSKRPPAISNPIIEPLWRGTRVLAHFRATPDGPRQGNVELRDSDGVDVSSDFALEAEALESAICANDAVIDGILTDQAMASGLGIGIVTRAEIRPLGMLIGKGAEITVAPPREQERNLEVAFVALDLLYVDGEPFINVPLLERKRQLEGLFVPSDLARISPYVRPPIAQWLNSWKSAGFSGVVMKASNSRYRPADVQREWAIIERVAQR